MRRVGSPTCLFLIVPLSPLPPTCLFCPSGVQGKQNVRSLFHSYYPSLSCAEAQRPWNKKAEGIKRDKKQMSQDRRHGIPAGFSARLSVVRVGPHHRLLINGTPQPPPVAIIPSSPCSFVAGARGFSSGRCRTREYTRA